MRFHEAVKILEEGGQVYRPRVHGTIRLAEDGLNYIPAHEGLRPMMYVPSQEDFLADDWKDASPCCQAL